MVRNKSVAWSEHLPWGPWPPHSNSDHQEYYIFRIGDPYKPSFTTVTVRGPYPTFTLQKTNMTIAGKPTMNESMYFLLKYGGIPLSC